MRDMIVLDMKMRDMIMLPMVEPAPQAISFNWYMHNSNWQSARMNKLGFCHHYASFRFGY